MTHTTLTDLQVEKNFAEAIQTAEQGPVIITKKGSPSHVLLTYDAYKRLVSGKSSISELFYYPGAADVEFESFNIPTTEPSNKID